MHTPTQIAATSVLPGTTQPRQRKIPILRRGILVVTTAAVLLLPCWWQSRIQAGDLSSHIYNAWLTTQIEQGRVQGLHIAWQWTNVLFDWMLLLLLKTVGPSLAQKIAVSIAVLVFSCGAFALIAAMSRQKPWFMLPMIAILAYGWVFYTGLFNFYVSVGFCLGALACLWKPSSKLKLWSIPLFVLGVLAHALPAVWLIGVVVFLSVARRLKPRYSLILLFLGICTLIVVRFYLTARFETKYWLPSISTITGADQVDLFGRKYAFLAITLMAFWAVLLILFRRQIGTRRLLLDLGLQVSLLTAAGVTLIPSKILLPGYNHSLVFIAERMSLVTAVLVTGMLARVKPAKWISASFLVIAILFWTWNYQLSAQANAAEDRIENVLASLPPGARVISTFTQTGTRLLPVTHAVDRACIGRCFSFGNYEPSTAQFRIRTVGPNEFVVSSYADAFAMQMGTYVVRPSDPPLYQVQWCDSRKSSICVRPLKVGETNGQILQPVRNTSAALR